MSRRRLTVPAGMLVTLAAPVPAAAAEHPDLRIATFNASQPRRS